MHISNNVCAVNIQYEFTCQNTENEKTTLKQVVFNSQAFHFEINQVFFGISLKFLKCRVWAFAHITKKTK